MRHAKQRLVPGWATSLILLFGVAAWPVQDEAVRLPGVPNLTVVPPPQITSDTPPRVALADESQVTRAVGLGRRAAQERRRPYEALAPWRIVVDKGGEYATLLSPDAVACMLGYYAEQRRWSDEKLQDQLGEALQRFGSGVCVYVELRSFAHVSRAFGSAGKVRPGTPSEAYEATFLLDSGAERFEGVTSVLDEGSFGSVAMNSAGLRYQRVDLPEVHNTTFVSDVHTWGESFGANYYVWWPLAELHSPDAKSLGLAVITPLRERSYSIPIQWCERGDEAEEGDALPEGTTESSDEL